MIWIFPLNCGRQLLEQAKNLVITGHIHPDGDCLGSMLALHEYLVQSGKQVRLLLDDDVPALYSLLAGKRRNPSPGQHAFDADLLIVVDASDADRVAGVKEVSHRQDPQYRSSHLQHQVCRLLLCRQYRCRHR